MKFKFSFAVIISIIFHISLFALAIYLPQIQKSSGPVYYVDLMMTPGGGGGNGQDAGGGMNGGGGNEGMNDTEGQLIESGSIKDLTVKKEEPSSGLRYPDQKNKDKSPKQKKEKEKQNLVTVVKKNTNDDKPKTDNSKLITTQRKGRGGDGLRTGISSGSGPGSGGGSGGGIGKGIGPGYGDGSGIGSGFFPYAYYVETLKSKISASWYSSLVSPGLKGKFTAVVYFRILRNGGIADLELEEGSGNNSLDLSSLRAIKDAAPFPPLPGDFPGQYLGVHFEFEWEK